jgi:two-component system response regulator PilR (NtrC family)
MCASHKDLAAMVATGQFRQDLFYRLNVLEIRMPTLRERAGDIPVLARAILAQLAGRYGDVHPKRLSPAAQARLTAYAFPGNVRELENLLERAYAFAEGEDIEVDDLGALDAAAERGQPRQPAGSAMPLAVPAPVAPVAPLSSLSPPPYLGEHPTGASMFDPLPASAVAGVAGVPEAPAAARVVFPIDLPRRLEALERELILQALQQTGFNRTAAAPLLGLSFRQLRYRIQQLGIRGGRDDRDDRDERDDGEDGMGEVTRGEASHGASLPAPGGAEHG